jgi:aminoglycoside/choline kinase family phosphotransferase
MRQWITDAIGAFAELRPASQDASFRRYFRIIYPDQSLIVMDAPPDREPLGPWLEVRDLLAGAGIHVPALIVLDREEGFVAMEDLGSVTYETARQQGVDPGQLFGEAWSALVRLAAVHPPTGWAHYDTERLEREMDLFWTWLVGRHLGLDAPVLRDRFANVHRALIDRALGQGQVWVHRDYHSRNLLFLPERSPGVIDFQDAVVGPASYDPVSLLRDCYVEWPDSAVLDWLKDYHVQACSAGLPLPAWPDWRVDFDWMGIQRHLKAAGIFARLWHRDGKPGYLADIPRTLGYVIRASFPYPSLAPFGTWIEAEILPALTAPKP